MVAVGNNLVTIATNQLQDSPVDEQLCYANAARKQCDSFYKVLGTAGDADMRLTGILVTAKADCKAYP